MCVRIQNESVDDIKINISKAINTLLDRINRSNAKTLYDHSCSWLQDVKDSIRKSGFDVFFITKIQIIYIFFLKSVKFFLEIFDFKEKYQEIFNITQNIMAEISSEILDFQAKKKEMISAKKLLKSSMAWNEYLFKDEENELEKEKMNSKQIEIIISCIDFFIAGLRSTKNHDVFEKLLFNKINDHNIGTLFEGFLVLFSHPNEKIISNCLKILEIIVGESAHKFKEIYKTQNELQEKLMKPLLRLFGKREMLETTEKSLFNTIYLIFEILYPQGEVLDLIELYFIHLKKKILRFLVTKTLIIIF